MAWPSRTADQSLSGDGVETLGVDFWDRDAITAAMSWSWIDTELDFSADTAWATQFTGFFRMPVWSEATAVITLTFRATMSGGSDNGDFRLRGRLYGGSFSTGATTSDPLTVNEFLEVTLAVPASPSWTAQVCEFTLDAQHTTAGGTWNIGLDRLMGNMRVVPISP